MPNNESYNKSPVEEFAKRLRAAGWKPIPQGLWEKGRHRLYVDEIGIFLYRLLSGKWVRSHGLSHNRILKKDFIRFQDGFKLNLWGD